MEWLSANWVWVLIGAAFVGMHLFGHKGHGSHGGGGCCGKKAGEPSEKPAERRPKGHQH